eukprot:scaffold395_cov243-Pinguiococcus_pyrenoidosus.AAC.14
MSAENSEAGAPQTAREGRRGQLTLLLPFRTEDASLLDEKLEALEAMQREVLESKGSVVPLELQKLVVRVDRLGKKARGVA